MKSKIYCLGIGLLIAYSSSAQTSIGGFPHSFQSKTEVPAGIFNLPDLTIQDVEELVKTSEQQAGPMMIGKSFPVNISFPESGTLVPDGNGGLIWKVKVAIPNSKGIGFHFDNFQLPKGVTMFVYNENQKHVLGAYTSDNNLTDNVFVTEAVQGGVAYLELNITDESLINEVALNTDYAVSYFRSVDYLDHFADFDDWSTIDAYDNALFGAASVCMINAVCPQSVGFENQRNATLQTLYMSAGGAGMCSASLVNNTGNTTASCTQYILTASHCETTGSLGTTPFSSIILRFDFQQPTCTWSSTVPSSKSLTGTTLVSRSTFTSAMLSAPNTIKADFMILKPTGTVPAGWNAILNGWNRSESPTLSYTAPKKFIGFHHPHGDIKSLSVSQSIESYSNGAPNTHWATILTEGYAGQGSSGSSLFNNEGQILGIASVAGQYPDASAIPSSCLVDRNGESTTNVMNLVAYSKLSYGWENPGESGAGDNKKIRPWLDPAGTGASTIAAVKSNCQPLDDTPPASVELNANANISFNVYPNPSKDGKFELSIKLNEPQDVFIEVYDVTGKQILRRTLPNSLDQVVSLDLGNVPNGLYMIKMYNAYGSITQKVAINKY